MKHILKCLFIVSVSIISGCQKISEYYTEKSVYSDCGLGPVSSELAGYLNFCGKTFSNPSLTIATSCLNRAVAVLPKLAPDCRAKYEEPLKNSIVSIVLAHMDGVKDPADKVGEPLTYETGARLFARWYKAANVLYSDSYSDYTRTEPGSFQAAFYSIFAASKKRVVKLMAGNGLLAFKSDNASGIDKSAERLSEIGTVQATVMFEEGAPELAIETVMPSLQSIANRAEVLLSISDITCKLARCVPVIEGNARYQLVQLLSSYLDKAKLSAAISSANAVPDSLKGPFNLLLNNSEKVDELIGGDNTAKQPVIQSFNGMEWAVKRQALRNFISFPSSASLTRFIRMSAHFSDIEENFLAIRKFDKRTTERLVFNPSSESMDMITRRMGELTLALDAELKELENRKDKVLTHYRDLAGLNTASFVFDAERLGLDLANALNDLDVMRQSLSEGRERRSLFLKEATSIASEKTDAFILDESQFKTIDTSNTIFDGNDNWTKLEEISANEISYSATDDELVSISVTGAWHPVCALKKSPLAQFATDDVLVGAGGFQMSMSSSSALVNSRGKERREISYTDQGVRAEVCAHAGAKTSTNTGVSASVCGYYQVGKRIEKTSFESETQSNSLQYSSAFEAGLRLPNTPFPDYPAGAVLAALQESSDSGMKTLRYLVVDKESSIVMKKGQKLQFVLNDCRSNSSSGNLRIEISPRISTAASSVSMLNDFSAILLSDEVNKRKNRIIQDGSSIESEIQTLRSFIMKNFAEKRVGDADYRKVPLVATIFDAWLDQEMLEVRKRYDIRMQERKVRDLSLQYSSFSAKMNAEVRVEKIQSEIFELSLANIDQNILTRQLMNILRFTDTSIMPLIDLYYPGLKIDTKFRDLDTLPLNTSMKIMGEKLHDTFKEVNSDVLDKALFRNIGGSQYQSLVIRIPRPETDISDSDWPVASMPIRKALWDYLRAEIPPQRMSLEIPVEALYQQSRIKGRLSCSQILPVIDSAMIGFVLTKELGAQQSLIDELNGSTITLTLGPKVQFATTSGAVDYRIVNGTENSSQVSQIPVTYGVSLTKLLTQINAMQPSDSAARAAFGYSPFGDFNFDGLNLIRNSTIKKIETFDGVEDIALIFKAKVNSTQTKPSWIGECSGGT